MTLLLRNVLHRVRPDTVGHTAHVPVPARVKRVSLVVDARILPSGHVEQPSLGAVRRVVPVRGALDRRPDPHAFSSRRSLGNLDRTAVLVQPLGPRHLDEVLAAQELPGLAIQYVEESVPVGPEHQLSLLPFPLTINQDGDLYRIPIPLVMRGELEVPRQFACVRVQGDDGIGI